MPKLSARGARWFHAASLLFAIAIMVVDWLLNPWSLDTPLLSTWGLFFSLLQNIFLCPCLSHFLSQLCFYNSQRSCFKSALLWPPFSLSILVVRRCNGARSSTDHF